MSKYGETDAAKDTDASTSKVSEAWHDAREHARQDGLLEKPGRFSRTDDSGQRAEGFWSSLFGKKDKE